MAKKRQRTIKQRLTVERTVVKKEPRYALTDHACRECGGRILIQTSGSGPTGGGNAVYRCADCGISTAGSSPRCLCYCVDGCICINVTKSDSAKAAIAHTLTKREVVRVRISDIVAAAAERQSRQDGDEPRRFSQMRGAVPGITGEQGAAEFVRSIRDE